MTNDIISVMRTLQTRLPADEWMVAEYVDAFLSGKLKDGSYIDPITNKSGTLRTFVDAAKYSAGDSEEVRKVEMAALAALHYRMARNYLEAAKC